MYEVYNVSCDSFCSTSSVFSAQVASQFSQVYSHKTIFIWIYGHFKNHLRGRVFQNVILSNFENIFQRNSKTDRAMEWILDNLGAKNIGNLPDRRQPLPALCGSMYGSGKNLGYATDL